MSLALINIALLLFAVLNFTFMLDSWRLRQKSLSVWKVTQEKYAEALQKLEDAQKLNNNVKDNLEESRKLLDLAKGAK